MGKIARGVNKIHITMLYGNYCYIFMENFPRKFSPCTPSVILDTFLQIHFMVLGFFFNLHILESNWEKLKFEKISEILKNNCRMVRILKKNVKIA